MRILFLAPQAFYVPRGTPIAIRATLEAISDHGHEVDVLTSSVGHDIQIPNVRLHRVRRVPFSRSMPIGPSWQRAVSDLMMLPAARRLLATERYDLIHGVEDGAVLARWLSQSEGIPYVYDMDSHMVSQVAGPGLLRALGARFLGTLERQALREASGVLAVCPALAEIAHSVGATNVAVVPDMPLFDAGECDPSPELSAIPGIRIVYVGNLERYQGVGLLIDAFRDVALRSRDATLVIIGGESRHITQYSESVSDLVAEGRIRFLGPRPLEQLGSLLAASDILVSPRLSGVNTPMKIFSYLESGRAVVATRLPTHTQVLDDRIACLVPDTPEGLADGLVRLLEDVSSRDRLGRQGQERVRAEFGRERFIERIQRFYDDLASSSTGSQPSQGTI